MTESFYKLPSYLKKYCVDQDYDAYTSRDHAAWRFIMQQNCAFFSKHAVSIYEEGLKLTGIPLNRIPRVTEMDEKLARFGWGAVAVNGFIPPAAFLEFQALGVLAIACDMRTAEHIEYTPAPDIVHEAAGHAPIIAEPEYANYLRRYAQMAKKAIFSAQDIELFEAVRYLSDIKENPDADPKEIDRAEERFLEVAASITTASEAAKVGRMAWWTVEYGLVGDMKNPLIYGAGLLSSVGESQNCLSDKVKKIPLTVDCVNQGFDITKPQPQLFVASNLHQLTEVLEEFEKTLSYKVGGITGLSEAKTSDSVNSFVFDSGFTMSGNLDFVEQASDGSVEFIKLKGPVQLAYRGQQLLGHGRTRHPEGYSSPFGRFVGLEDKSASLCSDGDLARIGIRRGREATLKFTSGFELKGVVHSWFRKDGKLLYMNWRNCTVRRGDKLYFQPEWGEFDLGIGEELVSVHGGPANRSDYGEYNVGHASTKPGRSSPYTERELQLFKIYRDLKHVREGDKPARESLKSCSDILVKNYPEEWLAAVDIVQLARKHNIDGEWMTSLRAQVLNNPVYPAGTKKLITSGLNLE